ncbi:outer membrane protein [Devosia sediminis]|uniref:Porin family protein n=1 Tax=Devosia sediminis TaxID=2798801 RepID=A0A934IND6_9HYPH|nr:outer membrane protein [Devosia sediminis]MBJ3783878.1 porin family protein [Devosia sediminis]
MRLSFVVAALAVIASPAMAADYPYYQPPNFDFEEDRAAGGWTGQYLGITVGGLRPRIDVPGATVIEGNGIVGGVFAGVNFQQDNGLVLGAEADAEYAGFHGTGTCAVATWTCRGTLEYQGSLRGRVGFAVDAFHVYGTAGLAVAHIGGSTTSPANAQFRDSDTFIGWTAGVGAEVAFSDAWFVRAEYRYTDYGSRDMTFDGAYPGVKATSHAVRAGLAYRF